MDSFLKKYGPVILLLTLGIVVLHFGTFYVLEWILDITKIKESAMGFDIASAIVIPFLAWQIALQKGQIKKQRKEQKDLISLTEQAAKAAVFQADFEFYTHYTKLFENNLFFKAGMELLKTERYEECRTTFNKDCGEAWIDEKAKKFNEEWIEYTGHLFHTEKEHERFKSGYYSKGDNYLLRNEYIKEYEKLYSLLESEKMTHVLTHLEYGRVYILAVEGTENANKFYRENTRVRIRQSFAQH